MRTFLSVVTGGRCFLHLGLAATMLALVGCASTPTRVDKGPVKARTFNFFDARGANPAPLSAKEVEVHNLIQSAITEELAAKGLSKVEKDGDVTVAYLIIVSDGSGTVTYNDFYGYGGPATDLQDKAHEAFDIQHKNRSQYDAGTLVIDLANYKQYEVYWRNFVWSPLLRDLPVTERKQRLKDAVQTVLKPLKIVR